MPRVELEGFAGPSWPGWSRNQAMERSINWYFEPTDGGAIGKNTHGYLRGTAGRKFFASLPDGPGRGIFAQDGRLWAAGGASLCEVFQSGDVVPYTGTGLAVDDQPVDFASNGSAGNQVALTSGGLIYIIDLLTNTASHIGSVNFLSPAGTIVFLDDYFIVFKKDSRSMYLSALLDGTKWDVLDVFEVAKFSDNLRMIGVSHEVLWPLGSKHAIPYADLGDLDIPFQPLPQTLSEHGIYSPHSLAQLDNTLFYQAQDAHGAMQIVKINGYTPEIVSTFGIQTYMRQRSVTPDRIIGWTFQEDGHLFYQLYDPTLDTSPVLDVATGLWHERALENPFTRWFVPDVGRGHAFVWGKHFILDRQSNAIYEQSADFYTDELVINPGTITGDQAPRLVA